MTTLIKAVKETTTRTVLDKIMGFLTNSLTALASTFRHLTMRVGLSNVPFPMDFSMLSIYNTQVISTFCAF